MKNDNNTTIEEVKKDSTGFLRGTRLGSVS